MNQTKLSKWLKFITIVISLIGVIALLIILPKFGRNIVDNNPEVANCYYPWLIFIWTLAIPFYMALGLFWSICNEIYNNRSFSDRNVQNLIWISKLAIFDSIYCFIGNILLLFLDRSHISVFIGFIFVVFVGIVIAIISATLSHLAKKANLIEVENELTV